MYAVIKTGGKQYKVAPGALVAVAKIAGTAGDTVAFEEVLVVGGENDTSLGSPLVSGATVAGEIVGQKRTAKILVFKKRRRQNSKRSRGHRQDETLVRITEILTGGQKPEMKKAASAADASTEAAAKPARKSRAKAAKSEDQE
jgi:large subunit ribosomal protein L21